MTLPFIQYIYLLFVTFHNFQMKTCTITAAATASACRNIIVSDKIICCLPYQISRKQGVKSVQLSGFTPSFHLDSPGKIDYDKCNQFYARPGGQTGVCVKNISIMIKPASSLCNMRCRYCFYADITNLRQVRSYGIMSRETTEKILENIRSGLQRGDQINFAFQGGEPALAGLDFYRHFVNLVEGWDKSIKVNYALQTNGLSLDEQWCRFLARHHFLVGISLDILPACHCLYNSGKLSGIGIIGFPN